MELGGIELDDYGLAHGVGTVALAIILFDGGFRTSMAAVRTAWKPALSLATLGVVVTAAIMAGAAHRMLELSVLEALLLGSIVASTDAAAVFSILRSQGLQLGERLGATLSFSLWTTGAGVRRLRSPTRRRICMGHGTTIRDGQSRHSTGIEAPRRTVT